MTMRLTFTTMTLAAGLVLASGATAAAQPKRPAPAAADVAPPVADERNARDTRQRLHDFLDEYPPSVAQVLRLDPSLISKPDYLAPYPSLAAFLAQHPEVAHNPVFFLGEPRFNGANGGRKEALEVLENILAGAALLIGLLSLLGAIVWLLRSVIDHRRWLRATKIQTDAHAKIVDRLASNEDLLAYMQSSAGQRFLSSAAVTIDASPQAVSAPLNRILWSVQAGVVIAAVGAGLWFAKIHVIDEVAAPLQVMAILAIALGVGFVVSALVSYALSRQLGLVQARTPNA
jgi:hypothetical protein